MKFTLCYKDYPCRMSLAAMKEFEEATGKCLWSTLILFIDSFQGSRANGDSISATLAKVGRVASFSDCASLLYFMAKQENSHLKIEEIEDAMFHAGLFPSEDLKMQPYQFVVSSLSVQVLEYLKEINEEKKKQAVS